MDVLNEDRKIPRKGFEIKSDESKPQEKIQNVYLYRDIFEATGKEYPKRIDCPSCKEKDKAEFRHGPYGVTSGTPGFAGYFCPECKGMIYIEPNTLFLCHPGSFMTSLDVLKAQYQKFDKPVGEIVLEKPKTNSQIVFQEDLFISSIQTVKAAKKRELSDDEKATVLSILDDLIEELYGKLDAALEKV